MQMRLRDQLTGGETEGLLEATELFVARRIRHPAGLDQREILCANSVVVGETVTEVVDGPAPRSSRIARSMREIAELVSLLRSVLDETAAKTA